MAGMVVRLSCTWNSRSRHSLVLKKSVKRATPAMRRVEQVLPAAADLGRGCAIAAFGDEGARRRQVAAAEFAVKAEMHDAARPQQRQQDAPAFDRIGHVMQHAGDVDHVEAAADRAKLEDVGLAAYSMRPESADGVMRLA